MANGTSPEANLDAVWEQADRAADAGDIAGVLFLLRSLADKGVWAACARIGEIYERGGKGVPRDMDQAIRWYHKAVFEADDPVAHLGLGRAYLYGDGVDLDYKKALEHLSKAHLAGLAEAAVYLGIMHIDGCSVPADRDQAERLLKEAAANDFVLAYQLLARIEWSRKRYLRALLWTWRGFLASLRVSKQDPSDRRLLGIGR
jgi:TPR repeat protein